ncbi:hypothetical protein CBR_g42173 [Chara braunii]|uniref:DDE Tnp4 domain-containing protein n=1 Tax=Chara braunii TaxID=69332 RepID=A0A388LXD4_CHABU|nr:hypothetical protein CBR_g42173 [Chara braunii]|eukprot:GBG86889.1 hypothetical protein CBR_g42173 [Chara braunii]
MNVGVEDTIADNDNGGPEDSGSENDANDHDEEDEDGEMDIRPVGRKRGVRSAPKKCSEPRARWKGKKVAEDTSAGEGSKSREFWSVEHMIALVRAKRGGESRGGEGGEGKRGRGHFGKSATKIVVDNSWDGDEEEENVAVGGRLKPTGGRVIGFRAGRCVEGAGRDIKTGWRKCCHRRPSEDTEGRRVSDQRGAVAEVTPAGGGVASSTGRGTIIPVAGAGRVEKQVASPSPTREELTTQQAGGSGTGKAKSPTRGGEGGVTGMPPPSARQPRATGSDGGGEERRVVDVRHEDDIGDGRQESDDDDDNCPSKRLKKHDPEDDLDRRSILWVDSDAFWGQGPDKPLREEVTDCVDYFIAIANGDSGAEPPPMLIMPPADIHRTKIDDPTQQDSDLQRATVVEKIVMRAIHGWIFKSSSRSNGFARAESYIIVDYATDPEQIVAYTLYRWAAGETYDSSTSSFGVGRAFGIIALRDVTSALLRVYANKIFWPTGVRKHVVLRAFLDKGFPNCHGAVDCIHIYVDKPANAPRENYFDRKHRFFVVAQVVVDLDLRVLDIFVGYPRSCHEIRIIQLSSLSRRAKDGTLFRGAPVTLPGGVRTNDYILGDNGYPPSEWVLVPYGGINQHPDEERFDTKQKVAKGAVERELSRLKGMWRLFLRTHKTNLDTLPQQFTAICILHNILFDAVIEFDENLLWEVDRNGVRRRVDPGIKLPPQPVSNVTSTDEVLALRHALAERMKHS